MLWLMDFSGTAMLPLGSTGTLLRFMNSTTRYLSELLFGAKVAGGVIYFIRYYLFEVFQNDILVYQNCYKTQHEYCTRGGASGISGW